MEETCRIIDSSESLVEVSGWREVRHDCPAHISHDPHPARPQPGGALLHAAGLYGKTGANRKTLRGGWGGISIETN